MNFEKLVNEEYKKYSKPKPKQLSLFDTSLYKNKFKIVLEQDDPSEDEPIDDEPMGPPDRGPEGPPSEEEESPPEIKLDNKPWNVIGYIAYRSLITDPTDIRNNRMFQQIMDQFGDIKSSADIKSPEHANKLLTAIQGVLDDIYTENDVLDSSLPEKEYE